MKNLAPFGATAGRILLALIFVIAGYYKIVGYDGAAGFMEKFGVPSILLPLVIVTELGGGLALIAGWQTKIAAFFLAGFTIVAALILPHRLRQSCSVSILREKSAHRRRSVGSHGPWTWANGNGHPRRA